MNDSRGYDALSFMFGAAGMGVFGLMFALDRTDTRAVMPRQHNQVTANLEMRLELVNGKQEPVLRKAGNNYYVLRESEGKLTLVEYMTLPAKQMPVYTSMHGHLPDRNIVEQEHTPTLAYAAPTRAEPTK